MNSTVSNQRIFVWIWCALALFAMERAAAFSSRPHPNSCIDGRWLLQGKSSAIEHVPRRHTAGERFPALTVNAATSKGDDVLTNDDNDEDYVFITPTDMYTGDPNDQRYSAADWWANVKSLPRSTILRAIQGPVVTVMVWSLLVSIIHGLLRRFAPSVQSMMCISSKPHNFLVSALGLLLVFRTNSAYQRFAEGRKIWENILSLSRNISRLACLYEEDLGQERKIRVFRLLGAFP